MSFADFVFNVWSWLFPALQWFVTFLVNPAPEFLVDFVNDFSDVIAFVVSLLGRATAIPIVSFIASAVSGVLLLIQAVFNVLSGCLDLPMGVTLIGLIIVFAIICVILDFFHKCFEALFDIAAKILDILT